MAFVMYATCTELSIHVVLTHVEAVAPLGAHAGLWRTTVGASRRRMAANTNVPASTTHGGDFLRIAPHKSGRGAYAARDAEPMQVIARDTFTHFSRSGGLHTPERPGVCSGCGAFIGKINSSLAPKICTVKFPDTSLQTWTIAASSSSHGDPHCAGDALCALCVDGEFQASDTFELMAARLLVLYVTSLVPDSNDWQRILQSHPAAGEKMAWFQKLHYDVSTVEPAFVARADKCVAQLSQLLSTETRGMISKELWLQTISKIALNSIDVKIPHPMVRYVAALDEETPDVRDAAYKSFRIVLAEYGSIEDAGVENNHSDSESESESDSESGSDSAGSANDEEEEDEEMDFDIPWGESTRTFSTAIFPPSEGVAVLGFCASINHSCEPNCEIVYIHDANALVVSTRAISEGDELTIPYVPTSLPVEKRRAMLLRRYGFHCECAKCQRELGSSRSKKRARR